LDRPVNALADKHALSLSNGPPVAPGAVNRLEEKIAELNAQKHDMCKNGLDLSGESGLSAEGIQSSLPSNIKEYVKGQHDPLTLYVESQYIVEQSR
jgi:hypothetical protein